MSKRLLAICLTVTAIAALSTALMAAPSLDIRKPPVMPIPSWTGPQGDPDATMGMWIKSKQTGIEDYRPYEFYDNAYGSGGSQGPATNCIRGVVTNIVYAGGSGSSILSFVVNATIFNDTPGTSGTWTPGSNSHGEFATMAAQEPYSGVLYGTELAASFAMDQTTIPPTVWTPPYTNRKPYIVATNNDGLAWYCWTPNNPVGKTPPGAYYVPTWKFGVIPTGSQATRTLSFNVLGGLPPTDLRYNVIVQSYQLNQDVFLNRTKSLKVSDWIDDISLDNGVAYPPEPAYKNSDVSVFHSGYEQVEVRDWGDAPDGPYPTWAASAGANHIIVSGLNLGPRGDIDGEADGQPDPNATGDDLSGLPDENGVMWTPPYYPGLAGATVTVIVTAPAGTPAFLDAWIDFNGDGSWLTAGDQIAAAVPVFNGPNIITFNVPATAAPGVQAFARFRLSTVGNLPPTGMAKDGEVEDHFTFIEEIPQKDMDWGDAPDPSYPTLSASGGASHNVSPNQPIYLGNKVDIEPDGQPSANADGDDVNGAVPDDEDGVVFTTPLVPGLNATATVTVTAPPGFVAYLSAWVDFGRDGSWATPGDQVFTDLMLTSGVYTLTIPVPASANAGGQTFTRWRLSTQMGLGIGGNATDGEVEDHQVVIQYPRDFGDAPDGLAAPGPYPTYLANAGAFHRIVSGFCLGTSIDAELDGQPDSTATGDDIAGIPDDEDGVAFNGPLVPGGNASVTVTTTISTGTTAYLDGWIDFNGDGNWATPGDQVFAAVPVTSGANVLSFTVPAGASVGITSFSRFRLSSNSTGLPFTGGYQDGEVEDYQVKIGYKWLQRPDPTTTGIDIKATYPNILADDFKCTVAGPITDIHLWGSWKKDLLPEVGPIGDPGMVRFILSFHEDIPAGSGGLEYSRPGQVLWWRVFEPGSFQTSTYASQLVEGWWDPTLDGGYIFPGDFTIYRYDFYIREEPFFQHGSEEKPKVYWLDVQAMPLGNNGAEFGWKTCVPEDRWNDDAVVGIGAEPYTGPWQDLHYPPGHPLNPETVDMAFALTGYAEQRDWGDAPDPTYPTLSTSFGANHQIVQGFCLGNVIDSEADGQPNANATGDDITNLFDEDGVVWLTPLVPGNPARIQVTLTTPGLPAFLDAWIDLNGDGSWATPGDQISVALPLAAGPNVIGFNVPKTWTPGAIQTYARFRLTTMGGVAFAGPASDGEVEDHIVTIQPDHGSLTFIQAAALRDHFWWPSNPDTYNEMISLKVSADAVEPVAWNSLTVNFVGGAAGDIASASVWQDVDSNNAVNPMIDVLLGAAAAPFGVTAIALTSPPVIPASGSIRALVAYTMSAAGAPGTAYTCRAIAAAGTGQLSLLPADIYGLPIASCRKILTPDPITIGAAKKLPVGSLFLLSGKEVTADFLTPMNLFYIEEKDRSNGIGVNPTVMVAPSVSIGDTVQVLGTSVLLNGTELVVAPQEITVGASMLPYLAAVGMNNKWTGGGIFGGQPAVFDDAWTGKQSVGLNNVGMLVRTWGLVTYHDSTFWTPSIGGPMFWINDGSDLRDGFWIPSGGQTKGVACLYLLPMGAFPNPGEYWGVTGIMRCIPNAHLVPQAVRLLVPRSLNDLTNYPMPP